MIRVWLQVLAHSLKQIGGLSRLDVSDGDTVFDFAESVLKKHPNALAGVDANSLTVYKLSQPLLCSQVEHTDFRDYTLYKSQSEADGQTNERYAWELSPYLKIMSWLDVERLEDIQIFVQAPNHTVRGVHDMRSRLRSSIVGDEQAVPQNEIDRAAQPFGAHSICANCYINLTTRNFGMDDFIHNQLIRASNPLLGPANSANLGKYQDGLKVCRNAPDNVFETLLRDKLPEQARGHIEPQLTEQARELIDPQLIQDAEFDAEFEMFHLLTVSRYSEEMLQERRAQSSQSDAHTVFFASFAKFCWSSLERNEVKIGFGLESWPLALPVRLGETDFHYTPKSDFFLSFHGIPRIVAEIKLKGADIDRVRMLVQGACLVRLINGLLAKKGQRRTFVLMAFYFGDRCGFERYLIYQDENNSEPNGGTVFYFEETFDDKSGRLRVVKELYSLAARMKKEGNALAELKDNLIAINNFLKQNKASTTRKRTQDPDKDGDVEQRQPKKAKGENNDALALDGYEAVRWALTAMKPPRLFVVRRLRDNQDLVAKVVEGAEEEKCILQYLREKDPIGRYIIPLESIASSNLGLVILLPVRASVRQLMKQSNGSDYGGRLVHFAEELIKGVAFIHRNGVAHLDIKPDNLVYTNSFRLQIIDFDVSVRVEDEYDMLCEEVGTSDYAAPEIGRGAFSPILADRWSCGKTIDELVEFDEGGGASRRERLSRFASRLMDVIPRQRPSLQEWSRFEETEGEDKDKVESLPATTIGFKRLYDESDDGSGKLSKLCMNEDPG